MKASIGVGIVIGGLIGGGIGSLLDHGDMFGAWGIILGTIGSLAGIWAGIQAYNHF